MKIFDRFCPGAVLSSIALIIAAPVRADVVLAWNESLTRFLAMHGEQIPVHAQARACAMLHLAIEQAVVAAQEPSRPIGASDDEQQAAAIGAAREMLVQLYPSDATEFDALATAQLRRLGCDPNATARAAAVGRMAAGSVLQKREADRWLDLNARQSGTSALSDPLRATWDATNHDAKSPYLSATPFVLKTAAQFKSDEPYWSDLSGQLLPNAGLARAKIFDSAARAATPEALAEFWCGSPVIGWNRIARAFVDRAGLDLAARARVLAVVNLAIADATLSSLHAQVMLNAWHSHRVEGWVEVTGAPMSTDVVAQIDGGDRTAMVRSETRCVLTPPMANFPSIAATIAGAAGAALANIAHVKPESLELRGATPGAGSLARTYSSVNAAALECAYASSLDGRHSRAACAAGYRLGESIGTYVAKQTRTPRR